MKLTAALSVPAALCCSVAVALLCAQPAVAADVGQKSSDILSPQYMLQVMGSLLLVLAAVFALAFVVKRFNVVPGIGSGEKQIQVLASTRLGGREKVSVANQLLLLGVAPGNLRTLHTFPNDSPNNNDNDTKDAVDKTTDGGFAAMLNAASRGGGKS